jgi:hypothetical protein
MIPGTLIADIDAAVAALRSAAHRDGDRELVHTLISGVGESDDVVLGADWDLQSAVDFVTDAQYMVWMQNPHSGHHLAVVRDDDSDEIVQFRVALPDGIEFPDVLVDNGVSACTECSGTEGNQVFRHYLHSVVKPKIVEHGWLVQGVFPTDAHAEAPGFCYTVGMTPAGLPELLLVGMPYDLAHPILTAAVKRHTDDEITVGAEVDLGFSVNFRFAAVADATTAKLATVARAAFPEQTVRAIQILFPDRNGRWPDDPASEFANTIFTADEVAAAAERDYPR